MSKRSEREIRVMRILEDNYAGYPIVKGGDTGPKGWSRDPGAVSGAIIDWNDRFPLLKFVQDGRQETNWTRDGRGTSIYDGVRLNPATMLHDWIAIKTASIGQDGKLPSKISITTGTLEHIEGVMAGVRDGASIPTVIFAEDGDGYGFALALDLSKFLRACGSLETPPEGGWERGKAPIAWIDPVSRKCGDGGKGIRIYNCLTMSLYACGFKKTDWHSCDAEALPYFVESSFDWNAMAKTS